MASRLDYLTLRLRAIGLKTQEIAFEPASKDTADQLAMITREIYIYSRIDRLNIYHTDPAWFMLYDIALWVYKQGCLEIPTFCTVPLLPFLDNLATQPSLTTLVKHTQDLCLAATDNLLQTMLTAFYKHVQWRFTQPTIQPMSVSELLAAELKFLAFQVFNLQLELPGASSQFTLDHYTIESIVKGLILHHQQLLSFDSPISQRLINLQQVAVRFMQWLMTYKNPLPTFWLPAYYAQLFLTDSIFTHHPLPFGIAHQARQQITVPALLNKTAHAMLHQLDYEIVIRQIVFEPLTKDINLDHELLCNEQLEPMYYTPLPPTTCTLPTAERPMSPFFLDGPVDFLI